MSASEIENREVSWVVLGIKINATVTGPADGEAHPAVVFVAGSGPTDRNWCSPLLPGTNGSAKLLAEKLAAHGYITVRYDKMASGPNVRENLPKFSGKASMESHLQELAGAVDAAAAARDGSHGDIFALTNSEGAIHAVNLQLRSAKQRFSGFILTGAPGRAVGEMTRSQLVNQSKSIPNAEALLDVYDKSIAQFAAGEAVTIDPTLPDGVKLLLKSLETPANLPFSRELWKYSLAEHISKVEEPILVLIGKKDIQSDWKLDGKVLADALSGKRNTEFAYPEDANHVLKHEELPVEKLNAEYVSMHYNAPNAILDEESFRTILNWLEKEKS